MRAPRILMWFAGLVERIKELVSLMEINAVDEMIRVRKAIHQCPAVFVQNQV
jgi:hypothetical protein